ncbi:hypothetical protein JKG68_28035 [Microvirga aerilata]|uniref:Uncharacterized protein n=1 Tax=Microvirga aerilata TaxID=670292 RepID=A0A937D4P2_9HYPH|nr:hypothetical protein [Microvirga aerilata]MBL0407760.1 hypothetical protein [Microvirga aerilata]
MNLLTRIFSTAFYRIYAAQCSCGIGSIQGHPQLHPVPQHSMRWQLR